jgi:hypothetical protein
MNDPILHSFLKAQHSEALALAQAGDILSIETGGASPPQRYVARFRCRGLVRMPDGAIREADEFDVGIWMQDDYLRAVEPDRVVAVLRPWTIWHPNVNGPFICIGRMGPATPVVDILMQVHEIITYNKWAAHDALNIGAAEWARNNQHRFPVDRRPLKWRREAAS